MEWAKRTISLDVYISFFLLFHFHVLLLFYIQMSSRVCLPYSFYLPSQKKNYLIFGEKRDIKGEEK